MAPLRILPGPSFSLVRHCHQRRLCVAWKPEMAPVLEINMVGHRVPEGCRLDGVISGMAITARDDGSPPYAQGHDDEANYRISDQILPDYLVKWEQVALK